MTTLATYQRLDRATALLRARVIFFGGSFFFCSFFYSAYTFFFVLFFSLNI